MFVGRIGGVLHSDLCCLLDLLRLLGRILVVVNDLASFVEGRG